MKQLILLISVLFLFQKNAEQPAFEDYSQNIPGTPLTIGMIAIDGGSFQMGSDMESIEAPIHEVNLYPFWMAKHETTWDLYRLYMERNVDANQEVIPHNSEVKIKVDAVSRATTPYVDMSFGMGTDGYPAIGMTQLAASKFCEWLSAMTGNFYRLPTEAEWEYAARAGSYGNYSFKSEDTLSEYAWYEENSAEVYHQVGMKKPNPWGLYDMHGNVAEWTLDKLDAYHPDIVNNPWQVPTKTYPRVVRGGSWQDSAEDLRSAARRGSDKSWKKRDPQIPKSKWWHTDAPFVGFRIVRPLKTPTEAEQKKYWGYTD